MSYCNTTFASALLAQIKSIPYNGVLVKLDTLSPRKPFVVAADGSFHVDVCLFTLDLGIALLLPQPPLIHC